MANDVFVNGREVSCKRADGKSICAFPDVCFTPPENPATPPGVPVPYPNTGMAKDMTSGSKSVKITGQEVMLKNKSYFKKSIGDEAGCAAKKGIVTSVNRGKVYFISWSMDVKFEGENVVRHLDMTTHNHASPQTNTPPWVHIDSMAMGKIPKCAEQESKIASNCDPFKEKAKCPNSSGVTRANNEVKELWKKLKAQFIRKYRFWNSKSDEWKNYKNEERTETQKAYKKAKERKNKAIEKYSKKVQKDDCLSSLRCNLVPYRVEDENGEKKKPCCPPQSPHHIVPKSQFKKPKVDGYEPNNAPCICLEGENQYQATHGKIHSRTAERTKDAFERPDDPWSGKEKWSCGEAEEVGADEISKEFGCDKDCVKAQLRKLHLEMGVRKDTEIKPTSPGRTKTPNNDSPTIPI